MWCVHLERERGIIAPAMNLSEYGLRRRAHAAMHPATVALVDCSRVYLMKCRSSDAVRDATGGPQISPDGAGMSPDSEDK